MLGPSPGKGHEISTVKKQELWESACQDPEGASAMKSSAFTSILHITLLETRDMV